MSQQTETFIYKVKYYFNGSHLEVSIPNSHGFIKGAYKDFVKDESDIDELKKTKHPSSFFELVTYEHKDRNLIKKRTRHFYFEHANEYESIILGLNQSPHQARHASITEKTVILYVAESTQIPASTFLALLHLAHQAIPIRIYFQITRPTLPEILHSKVSIEQDPTFPYTKNTIWASLILKQGDSLPDVECLVTDPSQVINLNHSLMNESFAPKSPSMRNHILNCLHFLCDKTTFEKSIHYKTETEATKSSTIINPILSVLLFENHEEKRLIEYVRFRGPLMGNRVLLKEMLDGKILEVKLPKEVDEGEKYFRGLISCASPELRLLVIVLMNEIVFTRTRIQGFEDAYFQSIVEELEMFYPRLKLPIDRRFPQDQPGGLFSQNENSIDKIPNSIKRLYLQAKKMSDHVAIAQSDGPLTQRDLNIKAAFSFPVDYATQMFRLTALLLVIETSKWYEDKPKSFLSCVQMPDFKPCEKGTYPEAISQLRTYVREIVQAEVSLEIGYSKIKHYLSDAKSNEPLTKEYHESTKAFLKTASKAFNRPTPSLDEEKEKERVATVTASTV